MLGEHTGLVVGVVRDLEDPEGLGRVRVEFQHLDNQMSNWARVSTPMGGNGRGAFFRPEAGDRVLVAFEQFDPRRPIVMGGVWSKTEPPPPDDGKAKDNNWRFIRTRSGHMIKFDDTSGAERIELVSSDGKRRVVLDSAGQKIQVECDSGDVEVTAAQGSVRIKALTVEIKADQSLTLEAAGIVSIKGQSVKIN